MATGRVPVMDKLRINQVVFNLLSNAVKYTPEGGDITYRARFLRSGRQAGTCGWTCPTPGIGISPEFQKMLFSTPSPRRAAATPPPTGARARAWPS
jgi:signal transduction histidine kinase